MPKQNKYFVQSLAHHLHMALAVSRWYQTTYNFRAGPRLP